MLGYAEWIKEMKDVADVPKSTVMEIINLLNEGARLAQQRRQRNAKLESEQAPRDFSEERKFKARLEKMKPGELLPTVHSKRHSTQGVWKNTHKLLVTCPLGDPQVG